MKTKRAAIVLLIVSAMFLLGAAIRNTYMTSLPDEGTPPAVNDVPTYDGTRWVYQAPPGASGGEANTASSLGSGAQLTAGKVGIDLQFNTLTNTDGYITIGTNANKLIFGLASSVALDSETTAAVSAHESDTTSVHGIADTSVLATQTYANSAVSTHESDTTSVHGIADTSVLLTTASTLNDDAVNFDDADSNWTATTLGPALEEMNDSINAGSPNGAGAKVHWSQLLGVPAGFADNTDDGAGGSGDAAMVNATSVSDSFSLTNTAASSTVASTTWSVTAGADPDPDKVSVAIGAASATDAGIMTAGTQTIGGAKTFASLIVTGNAEVQGSLILSGSGGGGMDSLQVTNKLTNSVLTATRVTFAGSDEALADDADLTFATDTLNATKLTSTDVRAGLGVITNSLNLANVTASRALASDGSKYVTNAPGAWTSVTLDTTNAVIDLAGSVPGVDRNYYYSLSTSNQVIFSNLVQGAQGTIWVNAAGTARQMAWSGSYDNFSTNDVTWDGGTFLVTNRAIIAYKVGWGTDATNVMLGLKRK